MTKTTKKNVQLLFNAQEYAYLENAAQRQGLPVPVYVKCTVLQNSPFYRYWQLLLQQVAALPAGTDFNVKSLFGAAWTMDKGTKLNLGKTFNNQVKAGAIPGVKSLNKDSSKVMWYRKI